MCVDTTVFELGMASLNEIRKIRDIRFVETYTRIAHCKFRSVRVKAVPWARRQTLQKCDLIWPREQGHFSLTKGHRDLNFLAVYLKRCGVLLRKTTWCGRGLSRDLLGYLYNTPHWGGGVFRAPSA